MNLEIRNRRGVVVAQIEPLGLRRYTVSRWTVRRDSLVNLGVTLNARQVAMIREWCETFTYAPTWDRDWKPFMKDMLENRS